MGAQIATVYGDDPAVQISEYAKVSGVTKIVMGRTNHRQNPLFKGKSLADKLTSLAGGIDIYIIPDTQPSYFKKKLFFSRRDEPWFSWKDLLKTLLVTALATLIGFGFFALGLRDANIIIIYILGVLVTAIWTRGHLYGAFASLLSVVALDVYKRQVNSLTAKGLLEEKGRLELPGRPLVYGTTSHFLRCFGLQSLSDLPPLPRQESDPQPQEDDGFQDGQTDISDIG